jgi:2-phosphosulfolactate phosphatase
VKIFVYHTPELVPTETSPDCAIAIDVLRATTTIAAALNFGAEAIQVFSNFDELLRVSDTWPSEKRIRAGERGGAKLDHCDMGNSPRDCTPNQVQGRRLFMTTTNGTRTLQRIQSATVVMASALVNRQAIVKRVMELNPQTLWLVGSGWEGSFALEDTVCAGAIAHQLQHHLQVDLSDLAANDEMVNAIALFQQWQNNLLGLMHIASHGQRLLRLEALEDLQYCAQLDTLDVLPVQQEPGVLKREPI